MIYYLFTIWVLLNIVDTIITLKILKRGGSELNPLLAYLFNKFTPLAVMAATKGVVLIVVFIFIEQIPIEALVILNAAYLFLTFWNLSEYRKIS